MLNVDILITGEVHHHEQEREIRESWDRLLLLKIDPDIEIWIIMAIVF